MGLEPDLCVEVGGQQMVVETVMAVLVGQGAVADVVLGSCRHLDDGREDLPDFRLQMDLVAEVMVMVAWHLCVVDILHH